MRDCMAELAAHRLVEPVRGCLGVKPVLGICMGLQVLFDSSDEDPGTPRIRMARGTLDPLSIGYDGWAGPTPQGPPHGLEPGAPAIRSPAVARHRRRRRFYFRTQLPIYARTTMRAATAGAVAPRTGGEQVRSMRASQARASTAWSSPPPSPPIGSSRCSSTPRRASAPGWRCSPTSWPGTAAADRTGSPGRSTVTQYGRSARKNPPGIRRGRYIGLVRHPDPASSVHERADQPRDGVRDFALERGRTACPSPSIRAATASGRSGS